MVNDMSAVVDYRSNPRLTIHDGKYGRVEVSLHETGSGFLWVTDENGETHPIALTREDRESLRAFLNAEHRAMS
jgi:hypothetical protein